jgi:hypothetical protein
LYRDKYFQTSQLLIGAPTESWVSRFGGINIEVDLQLVRRYGVASPDQVHLQLQLMCRYGMDSESVRVRRYRSNGFLVNFTNESYMPASLMGLSWWRQWGARFAPLHFKVLLAVENIPAHVWSV